MSIANHVLDCAQEFRKLRTTITERNLQGGGEGKASSVFASAVNDSFERFQLWSSNLGAHRRDKNSLDQRLWEASHLKNRVLEYLQDLQQALTDASAIILGERTPWEDLSSSSEEDGSEDDDETELEQLAKYMRNTINCLLRISMVIQKPSPHDRFIKSGRFDQSHFLQWDENHVRDKFANVPEWLAERLGKAITRRRQFLEYRKAHHERIASVEPSNHPEVIKTEDTKSEKTRTLDIRTVGTTMVSSLPTEVKNTEWGSAATTPHVNEPDVESEAGQTETSYAETAAGESIRAIPKMPDAAQDGAMFECPYCYMIIGGIRNRLQWKRHVFTDLQPYICLHSECTSADETFPRRYKWIEHEIQFHSRIWKCNIGCEETFSVKADMREHFTEKHDFHDCSDAHLVALSIQVQRDTSEILSCPLCHDQFDSLQRYQKHAARHLEQLALFALPKDSLENEDTDDEVDDESGDRNYQISNASSFGSSRSVQHYIAEEGEDALRSEHGMTQKDISDPELAQKLVELEGKEAALRQLWHGSQDKLGPRHKSTCLILRSLTMVLKDQKKYQEAEKLLRDSLEGWELPSAVHSPGTIDIIDTLGRLLYDQTKIHEATTVYREALDKTEQRLGYYHEDTLRCTDNLAWILNDQGKHEEAEKLYRKVLEQYQRVPLSEQPEPILSIRAHLAVVLQQMGGNREAEKLHREALEGYERNPNIHQRHICSTMSHLGILLQHRGDYEEAENLHRKALQGYEREPEKYQTHALKSSINLASVLEAQWKLTEAEELYRKVVEIHEHQPVALHLEDALKAMSSLGDVLETQERYEESETLLRKAIEGRENKDGFEHPSTLKCVSNLANALMRQNRNSEAETLYRRALEGREKQLGILHPDTLESVMSLARVLKFQGEYESAERILRRASEGFKALPDIQHQSIRERIGDLETKLRGLIEIGQAVATLGRRSELLEKQSPFHDASTSSAANELQNLDTEIRNSTELKRQTLRTHEAGEKSIESSHPRDLRSSSASEGGQTTSITWPNDEHLPTNFRRAMQDGTLDDLDSLVRFIEKMPKEDTEQLKDFLLGPSGQTSQVDSNKISEEESDPLNAMHGLDRTLLEEGKWTDAEELFKHEAKDRELGTSFHLFLVDMSQRARILTMESKYEEAKSLYRWVIERRENELGKDHVVTLKATSDLAKVLKLQKNYSEAETLYRKVTEGARIRLGVSNPKTLSYTSDLAMILEDQEEYDQAEKLYRQVLKGQTRELGLESSLTLTTMSHLAGVLLKTKNYSEAEILYREVAELREKELDIVHPERQLSLRNLAKVLRSQNKEEEAEAILERLGGDIAEDLEEKRTPEGMKAEKSSMSSDMALCGPRVANVTIQGKFDEFEEMDQQKQDAVEKTFQEAHPATPATPPFLREGSGDLTEPALPSPFRQKPSSIFSTPTYFQTVHFNDNEQVRDLLRVDHPIDISAGPALDSFKRLARMLQEQGRNDDAEQLYRRALEAMEKCGTYDFHVLQSAGDLARVLRDRGDYEKAEAMLERVLKGLEQEVGENHNSTITTMSNLGDVYRITERMDDAERMYIRKLRGYEERLGIDSVRTLSVVHNLGHFFQERGKLEDAETMFRRAAEGFTVSLAPSHERTQAAIKDLNDFYKTYGKQNIGAQENLPKREGNKKQYGFAWHCGECGDGPYGTWQPSCQKCQHTRCNTCTTESW